MCATRATSGQRLTVIGGGLAGPLLAIRLARAGYPVDVFERLPDPEEKSVPGGRSINLALAERGRQALREAGLLEAVDAFSIPMYGRMLHPEQGEPSLQRYSQHAGDAIYSVHRDRMNRLLLERARATPGVRLFFDRRLLEVDFVAGRAIFAIEGTHEQETCAFNVLFGCDGAGSGLRQAMAAYRDLGQHEDWLDHGYRELSVPPGPGGSPQLEPNALHVWPRGGYMLIALPNPDNSFTATLFLPKTGTPGFDKLPDAASMRTFLDSRFADVSPLLSRLETDMTEHPVSSLGTLRCRTWHIDGKALLLGDAAHAIVPFHGQGMNAAMEDITHLMAMLDTEPDWASLFARFNQQRLPDANAIADMALENYQIMREAVRDPRYHLKNRLEWELERRFPQRFVPRYSLVMFHRLPYSEAHQRGVVQDEIMETLLDDAERVEDVDFDRAQALIQERLEPLAEVSPERAGAGTGTADYADSRR